MNEQKKVALRTSVTTPCLAFAAGSAFVLISRAEIEELAVNVDEDQATPGSRMRQLNRTRAQELLSIDAKHGEVKGCPIARDISIEGNWLIIRQIELGQAAIVNSQATDFIPYAIVHYIGRSDGRLGAGFINIWLPGVSRAIYAVPWWLS